MAVSAYRRARNLPDSKAHAGLGEWGWISASVLIPSAVVVCIPSNFDPGFFVPALGPLAIWLGRALAALRSRLPARAAWAGALVLSVLAMDGASALARPRDLGGIGPIVAAIQQLPLPSSPPFLLCNVGSASQWNAYKIRLAVELSRPRIRHAVADLSGAAEPDREALAACAAFFRLDFDEVPRDGPNQYANLGWRRVSQPIDTLELSPCSTYEARAGEVARVEVLLRADSDRESKRGRAGAVAKGGRPGS